MAMLRVMTKAIQRRCTSFNPLHFILLKTKADEMFLFLRSDGEFILHADHRAGWGGWGWGVCISSSLLTLWEQTSYKTGEAHFHFKGSSETWHQQASLLALACCMNARTHTHTHTRTHTHTHTLDRLTFTDTHTHNVSPSPPLLKCNVYSYLRKMRWYSFSTLKNSQKQKKNERKKKKCGTSKPCTVVGTH